MKFSEGKMNFEPRSKQVNKEELKLLLNTKPKKVRFCFHDWKYWTFGSATRVHRVCSKCYKKQQNADIIYNYDRWIKEENFD